MMFALVRMKESRQAIGVFGAPSIQWLRDYVDMACNPNDCEYKPITKGGGFFFSDDAPAIPQKLDDEYDGVDLKLNPDMDTTEGDLWNALYGKDKGWKDLKPSDGYWIPATGNNVLSGKEYEEFSKHFPI